MTIEELEAAAMQLPAPMRAQLAAALISSLEHESEFEEAWDDGEESEPIEERSRSDPPSAPSAQPATPVRIDANDLCFALDSHFEGVENYLDVETGEIIPAPWDALTEGEPEYDELYAMRDDAKRYRLIHPVPSRRGWLWMRDYAETVADSRARERLLDAIEGGGAFGRFKHVLSSYEDLRQAWFRFHEEQLLGYAREWLAEENIEAELTPGPRLME
ncbi:MAG TPA: UPF0158 family protein [Longimicrobium sp.]|nr:UPF0158 family protein [Longimicrobium sp.]